MKICRWNMSAKLLFTFKHFKFPLLPLLTHSAVQIIRTYPAVLKFVQVKYPGMNLFMKIFWSLPCSAIIRKFPISWKYSSCLVGNNQEIANPANIQRTFFFSVAGLWSMIKLGMFLDLPLFLDRGSFSNEVKKR